MKGNSDEFSQTASAPGVLLSHAIFISQRDGSAEVREAGLIPRLWNLNFFSSWDTMTDLQESAVLGSKQTILWIPKRGFRGTLGSWNHDVLYGIYLGERPLLLG